MSNSNTDKHRQRGDFVRAGWRIAVLTLLGVQALGWLAADSAGAAQTEIMDFGYAPDDFGVAAGDQVTWLNTGAQVHTVIADPDSPERFSSAPIEPGERFTHTFETPGTISYHCELHRSMKGVVRVVPRPATNPKPAPAPTSKDSAEPSTTTATTHPPSTTRQTTAMESTPATRSPTAIISPAPTPQSPVVMAQPGSPGAPPTTVAHPEPIPPSTPSWAQPAGPEPDDGRPLAPTEDFATTTTATLRGDAEVDAVADVPSGKRSSQPSGWADLPMAALGAALIACGAGWLVKIRLDQRLGA